jgi:hypothetical protein
LNGGATFPALPSSGQSAGTPATFNANIDNGLVQYSANGVLRTIDWRTFMVGLQYYLPPHGRVLAAANYTQGESDNLAQGLVDSAARGKLMVKSQFFDVNLFGDVTPALRAGCAWEHLMQTRGDGAHETNDRFIFSAYYFF